MRAPFVRDLVDLLATLLRPRSRVAEVLKQRQRQIDRSGARRIHPNKTLLDLLDDLVAVARLPVEKTENHELQMTLIEHPAAAKRAAARLAATTPKGAGIEPEVLRSHPERPGEPRPAVSTVH